MYLRSRRGGRGSEKESPRPGAQPTRPEAHDLLIGARGVYEALCAPANQRIGGFEIAARSVAARHVSGDFVSAFECNQHHYVALGDLMGKGLSAAMWLTHVLDLLRRACEHAQPLPATMEYLNREMYRSRVGVPLTSLFLMRLKEGEARVSYSCGGCPPAFLFRSNKRIFTLQSGGPILGALESARYSAADIDFRPNDMLLVASDGITELHRGMTLHEHPENVARHLRYVVGASAQSVVTSVLERVKRSSPMVTDDLTVMAVRRAS